jgi:hypothetical protein
MLECEFEKDSLALNNKRRTVYPLARTARIERKRVKNRLIFIISLQ